MRMVRHQLSAMQESGGLLMDFSPVLSRTLLMSTHRVPFFLGHHPREVTPAR